MPRPEEEAQYHEARFLALISGLSAGAMQHLGKVINPLTGKIERDLEAAQGTIELLRTLREKTKGNLTDRESNSLESLLSSLQLNYLDEMKAEAAKAKEEKEKATAGTKEEAAPERRAEQAAREQTQGAAPADQHPEGVTEGDETTGDGAETKSEQDTARESQPEEEKTGDQEKTMPPRADE